MKIVVVSDTHNSSGSIQKIGDISQNIRSDLVIHLGDFYDDLTPESLGDIPLIRVPGTWTSFYQNPLIDNRRVDVFQGWRFFLSHTPEKDSHDLIDDVDPQAFIRGGNCDVFLHGHTHHFNLESVSFEKGSVLVCNPGHLSESDSRTQRSYCILEVSLTTIIGTIMSLEDQKILCTITYDKKPHSD